MQIGVVLVRFERQFCIAKEVSWVTLWKFMEAIADDCDFMLKSSEKTFSISLLQFLASEDLGLPQSSNVFHHFGNLEIMFSVSKLEPDLNRDPFGLNVYFLCFHEQV